MGMGGSAGWKSPPGPDFIRLLAIAARRFPAIFLNFKNNCRQLMLLCAIIPQSPVAPGSRYYSRSPQEATPCLIFLLVWLLLPWFLDPRSSLRCKEPGPTTVMSKQFQVPTGNWSRPNFRLSIATAFGTMLA